jgi:hypothetical protein
MEKFTYKIAGRTHGVIEQTIYEGSVEADDGRQAMLKALAAEFGDRGHADPVDALDGWADRDEIVEQFKIDVDDTAMEFENGDLTFVIEVVEA